MMNDTLKKQIESLLNKDLPFALYYLPGESEVSFIAGKLRLLNATDAANSSHKGFVFAPYRETPLCPSLLVTAEYVAQGDDTILGLVETIESARLSSDKAPLAISHEVSQFDFEALVTQALAEIQNDDTLQKVVVSRVKNINLSQGFLTTDLLEKMQKTLPSAFCYLCYIPGIGTWMGATPERLLEIEGTAAQTNALAGTLRNGTQDKWSQKEKDEQQIVTDYIANQLEGVGMHNYVVDGPTEMASGSVRHLRSVFRFDLENNKKVWQVIKALHPTPAVCGMPKDAAADFIASNENYEREYYTGYLGPVGIKGASHIFVNLRCMKIVGQGASLYVGAGITSGSKADKEWEETEIKALTLLNVIRN